MKSLHFKSTIKHIATRIVYVLGAISIVLSAGCAVNPDSGRVGMDTKVFNSGNVLSVGGGLLSAAICNQVFKRHGSKEGWTAACGIGGYFLSRAFVERSSGVLEKSPTGKTTTWKDPDGRQVSMTPKRTWYRDGEPCREYETEVLIDGQPELAVGSACRMSDGSWRIES